MDNNVNIEEELRIKNQELLLNKRKIDLDTSMDSVIVFFSNYTNGLVTEVQSKVCELKNIDSNSDQSKIIGYTITQFFSHIADELKQLVLDSANKIKEKINILTDDEYKEELQNMTETVIKKMKSFCNDNVAMLVDELVGDEING